MRRVEFKRAAAAALLVACAGAGAPRSPRAAQEAGPAATFVVNSTADDPDLTAADGLCLTAGGLCTLRAAIEQANADPSADAISFLIPPADAGCNVVGNVCTITPNSPLPAVSQPASVDGYSQPLASENTLAVGDNAQLKIELAGANAGPGADGLHLTAGGSTVRGLAVHGFGGDGIELSGAGGNLVSGNFIGHTALGNVPGVGNAGDGVRVSGVGSNQIGGATPQARNLIASNFGEGVHLLGAGATANVVAGNYIGTDRGGAADFGNRGNGVSVAGPSNLIGGPTAAPGAAPGNVISGNGLAGLRLAAGANGNTIAGNLVGLRSNGAAALRNDLAGVLITGGASSNTVGGAHAAARNVVSGNASHGVELSGAGTAANVVAGNYVGTDSGGAADLGNGADGVNISGGAVRNTVGGLTPSPGAAPGNVISGNNSDGVEIENGTAAPANNVVQGNLVGTTAAGTAALRNSSNGVLLFETANNLVGGSVAQARNVITGGPGAADDGVDIQGGQSSGNVVAGNYIGTDINGAGSNAPAAADFGAGGDGVRLSAGPDDNLVGGLAPSPGTAPGNVIAGNNGDGVELSGGGTTGNLVRGNLVGTRADGATAYANGAHGVHLSSAASANVVGGTAEGAANVIAFNGGDGLFAAGGAANSVRRNSIHSNAGLGIDLGADGVTPNDADDPDPGANNLQNFPSVTSATAGSTVVSGTLNSTPSTAFVVELFSSAAPDPAAHGEGQTFLEQFSVTTDAGGDASFTRTLAMPVAPGRVVTATATDPAGNTSEFSNTRLVAAPTAARLRTFRARAYAGGVLLEWQTSFEVDNLGFNLYREEGGRRETVNPSLVAGSALISDAALTAGHSYAWFDREGTTLSRYYLEDVDTDGTRTAHGPFHPARAEGRWTTKPRRSPLLEQLGPPPSRPAQRQVWTAPAEPDGAEEAAGIAEAGEGFEPSPSSAARQRELAAGAAVKLYVRRAGWHRVTRAQLEAAGLAPSADPARLQLYADGAELAVSLDESAWSGGAGAVEFYGEGLDTPSTDARVYWLVEGSGPGRRVGPPRPTGPRDGAPPAGPPGVVVAPPLARDLPRSFTYTLELKERLVYFSSLRNGDAENFFGRVVAPAGLVQTLDVQHIDRRLEVPAQLRVALQGVTNVAHEIEVELNGSPLGSLSFEGRAPVAAEFRLSPATLREGANELRLKAVGGPSDVSLTDSVRLSYTRLFRADGDRLWFPAHGGSPARVAGFTSADVRVVDVSDPSNVTELDALVEPEPGAAGGGFAVTVTAPDGAGARTLLAFAGRRVETGTEARPNRPSNLRGESHAADYLVLTRAEFREALAPLLARRAAEGLAVEVVEVEDVFDEFSFGAHSPGAVKEFLAHARAAWRRPPRYLLLAGDGSYDPRDRLGRGAFDLVPAKLVDTGSMEAVSDDWFADFDGDGLAELATGRLPVRTPAEAAAVAAKLAGQADGPERPSVLLVSDRRGPDGFDFGAASASLAPLVPPTFDLARIERGAQGGADDRARLVEALNEGPAVVNYLGHGSLGGWAGDGLLRSEDALRLANSGRLSLFVLMTCLNGHFADPALEGLGEALLRAGGGGALAVWGSSAMTAPEAQAAMNRELYRALFGGPVRLGDAVRQAKSATSDPDARRSWVLLGDPAARVR